MVTPVNLHQAHIDLLNALAQIPRERGIRRFSRRETLWAALDVEGPGLGAKGPVLKFVITFGQRDRVQNIGGNPVGAGHLLIAPRHRARQRVLPAK